MPGEHGAPEEQDEFSARSKYPVCLANGCQWVGHLLEAVTVEQGVGLVVGQRKLAAVTGQIGHSRTGHAVQLVLQ
jgi:hypothetical protein